MPPSTLLRLPRSLSVLSLPLRAHARPRFALRPLSTCAPRFAAAKDSESNKHSPREAQKDRHKMSPEADENALSGSDDAAAANEEAAFDPNITDPQEAKKKAGEGNEGNPLEASPANPDLSAGTAEEEGGSKKKESE